jgi:hypothetical protein
MKKKIYLLIFVLALMTSAFAQENTFQKGSGVLNLTIGFGNGLYSSGATSSIPPIAASYEIGIVDNVAEKGVIGIGGYIGYTSAKFGDSFYSWKYTDIVIGARGVFHYPFVEKLDTYAGLLLAYDINSVKYTGTNDYGFGAASVGGFKIGIFAGARYYFSDMFAGLIEVGTGLAYFNIGVALKLK